MRLAISVFTFIFVLLLACSDSSLDTPTVDIATPSPLVPAAIGPPQTSIFCSDCQLVDVKGIVDGDTIDTSVGRVRFFGVDTPEAG